MQIRSRRDHQFLNRQNRRDNHMLIQAANIDIDSDSTNNRLEPNEPKRGAAHAGGESDLATSPHLQKQGGETRHNGTGAREAQARVHRSAVANRVRSTKRGPHASNNRPLGHLKQSRAHLGTALLQVRLEP